MDMDMDYGQDSQQSQSQKPFPVKLVVGMLVGAAVLAAAVLIIIIQTTAGPRESADGFLAALKAGDNAAAYEHTSVEFKQEIDVEGFNEVPVMLPVLANYEKYSFNYSEVSGDEATLSGEIIGPDGTEPLTIVLVKEEGRWKVFSLSLQPEDSLEFLEAEFE